MTLDQVRDLATTLQTRGETLSANIIVATLGGSKRDATKFLRQVRAEAPPTLQTPVPARSPAAPLAPPAADTPPAPVPLLVQAEADLQAALLAERRARRDLDSAPRAERERGEEAWLLAKRERERSATRHDQLQRGQAADQQALPSLRVAARRAAGDLAGIEDQVRRALIKAQREAQQTDQAEAECAQRIVARGGPGAVPKEEGA